MPYTRIAGMLLALGAVALLAGERDNDPKKVGGSGGFRIQNPIDSYILYELNQRKISPSVTCSDEEFVRRAYLDVIGTIPPASAVKAFMADRRSDKRARLIDALLASDRYGAHWAVKWGDLLREHSRPEQEEGSYPGTYRAWLREALNKNLPYDQFAAELITASGRANENGAVNFYLRDNTDRVETVNTISSAFMGTRMACAQCHDHPFDQWEQKDFHSLMAFLQPRTKVDLNAVATLERMKAADLPDDLGNVKALIDKAIGKVKSYDSEKNKKSRGRPRSGYQLLNEIQKDVAAAIGAEKAGRFRQVFYQYRVNEVSERSGGDYRMPAEGDSADRRRPGGEVVEPVWPWDPAKKAPAEGSRREALAKFLAEDPQFAKVHVNRLWDAIFGRGLVHPIDDFRAKNPPSHPELLDYLAKELVDSKWDTKHVLRLILTSGTYERSSKTTANNKSDEVYFSHRVLRRMTAEQLYDSILIATGQADPGVKDVAVKAPDLRASAAKNPAAMAGSGMAAGGSAMNGNMMGMADEEKAYNTKGNWAFDIPTPAYRGSFLQNFNQPTREEFIAERDDSATITQALELFNGRPINDAIKAENNAFVNGLLASKKHNPQTLLLELYLNTLARVPSGYEYGVALRHLGGGMSRDKIEDVHWAIMNSREFMFIK